DSLMKDPRYTQAQNEKLPPKIGSKLELFDCITCDKCVPVCPNDANFTYVLPTIEIPVIKLRPRAGGGWDREVGAPLAIKEKHQIATYADFCNECGNCDVFCPEDGGPYVLKPRFFGSHAEWARLPTHDGFFVERVAGADRIHGRFGGKEYALSLASGRATYAGEGFLLTFAEAEPEATMSGSATGEVDLTYFHIMNWLRKAVLDRSTLNYVNA
ncbi:MAG TPA: 4Fe-4S dicluster domain-containing protein, partial [Polyangiaceae bacterium]